MSYIVTAPLVLAKTPRGIDYVYQNGTLAPDADSDQLAMLIDDSMVVDTDAKPGPKAAPKSDGA